MEIEKVSGRYVVDGKMVTADQFLAISQENAQRLVELEDENSELARDNSALRGQVDAMSQTAHVDGTPQYWLGVVLGVGGIVIGYLLGTGLLAAIGAAVMSVVNVMLGLAVVVGGAWLLFRLYRRFDDTRSPKPATSQTGETEELSEQSPKPAKAHQAEEVQDEDQATGNSVMDRLSRYESHAPHGYKPLSGDDVSSETETTEQEPESKPSLLERMLAGSE